MGGCFSLGALVAGERIVFVALWVATLIVVGDGSGNSNEEILSYYAKSGNRDRQTAGFLLILAASLFFLWFLASLRARLVRVEGGPGTLAALAFGAGLVSTALWVLAGALFGAVAFAVDDSDEFRVDPDTERLVDNLGYAVFVSAATIALVLVVATSLLALRTGVLPKWLAWLGFPVALTLLVSFTFIPFLILLGWVLVVSVTFLWRERAAEQTPQAGNRHDISARTRRPA